MSNRTSLFVGLSLLISYPAYASFGFLKCLDFLTRSEPTQQVGEKDEGSQLYAKASQQAPEVNLVSAGQLLQAEESRTQLLIVQKEALEARISLLRQKVEDFYENGQSVLFNGRPLRILHPLGFGTKGVVYLVEDEAKLKALKVLFLHENMTKELENYEALEHSQAPSVRLSEIDDKNGQILLGYIDGIPVNDIIHNTRLDLSIRRTVRLLLMDFGMKFDRVGRILPYNLILELKTGNIVFIDRE